MVMFKKLVGVLLIIFILSMCGLNAFADPTNETTPTDVGKQDTTVDDSDKDVPKVTVDDILNEALQQESGNGKKIVSISKPEDDKDSTYKKTYVISGVTDYDDVKIVLTKYDSDEKKYVPLKDEDGKYKWDVGSFGAFAREITLTKGANKIRLLAYHIQKEDELKLDDVQIKDLTITLLNETIKDKVINTFVTIKEQIKNAFEKNSK
jgi:hypothetical protein